MTHSAPGPILRFTRGLWNTVNFTRRLVFNLVFLLLAVIVLVVLFSGRPELSERNALVLAPQGEVVEQFSADPIERALLDDNAAGGKPLVRKRREAVLERGAPAE